MDDEFLTLDQIDSLNHVDLTNTDAIGSLSLDESPTIALDAKHVGEIRKPILVPVKTASNCYSCSQGFGWFKRPHNCYGCGQVFCDACADDWLLLPPDMGYFKPKRVCKNCLRKWSLLDYTKQMDIGGPDNAPTIIILPGALQNRATMTYLFEVLVGTNQYKVINMDLPGLGSRVGEPLNRSTCVEAVKKVIQDHATGGKALLLGYSLGGYIAMTFASEHASLCSGLILGGCSNEVAGATGSGVYLALGAVYKVTPKSKLWTLLPTTFPNIPRERLDKAILRNPPDFKMWSACAETMREAYTNYYLMCLKTYDGPVMLINGEKDFRSAEDKFMVACKKGRKVVIWGGSHMCFLEGPMDEFHKSVLHFVGEVLLGIEPSAF